MPKDSADHAHVLLPPPALFGGALLAGLALDWLLGWHLPMPLFARSLLALILIVLGAVPLATALVTLHKARTAIVPWHSTSRIINDGPFRYTRNPIYLGMILIYLALVIWLGSGAGFMLLLPVLFTLHFGVVLREEAYLSHKFGEAYKAYCEQTPRWLQ